MELGFECPRTLHTTSYGTSSLIIELAREDLSAWEPCFLFLLSIPTSDKYFLILYDKLYCVKDFVFSLYNCIYKLLYVII